MGKTVSLTGAEWIMMRLLWKNPPRTLMRLPRAL